MMLNCRLGQPAVRHAFLRSTGLRWRRRTSPPTCTIGSTSFSGEASGRLNSDAQSSRQWRKHTTQCHDFAQR